MLWARLRLAAAMIALRMTPPRTEAARGWLTEAETALTLIGGPLHRQELKCLQAHLAFHEGRRDEARRLCAELQDGDQLLAYGDRVRLAVLRGRITILDGQTEDGIDSLQALARQATEGKNLDLAAHVWQVLAITLADVRHDR